MVSERKNTKGNRRPKGRVQLRFRDQAALAHLDDPLEHDLSAAARTGDALFLSCDETAGLERLTPAEDGWGNHLHLSLADYVDLPDGPEGEMDIEGLACDEGWLWVVGSHSLKREKPKDNQEPAAALARMEKIKRDPNRYFLGRFPLVEGEDGPVPASSDGERRAAHVRLWDSKSTLHRWLKNDPHIGPFLGIPSKENGFDVEGVAARGLRVWLGLRGPVLRGWAVVIEMEMKVTGAGHLKAARIDGDRRYRKHLLPAHGLGVRDLTLDGDDLLLLVGPTMATDGPAHVLRWKDAATCRTGGVHPESAVAHVLELPYNGKVDHPEGLVRWGDDWLVVYDSPSEHRLEQEGAVVAADIWAVP